MSANVIKLFVSTLWVGTHHSSYSITQHACSHIVGKNVIPKSYYGGITVICNSKLTTVKTNQPMIIIHITGG